MALRSSGLVLCGAEAVAAVTVTVTVALAVAIAAGARGPSSPGYAQERSRCAVERGDMRLCCWLRVLGDGHTARLAATYPLPPSAKKKSKKSKTCQKKKRDEREMESQRGGFGAEGLGGVVLLMGWLRLGWQTLHPRWPQSQTCLGRELT